MRIYLSVAAVAGLVLFASCRSTSTPQNAGGNGGFFGMSSQAGTVPVVNRNADASQVQLADGSRWAIQPAGQAATLQWQPNDPIEILSGQGHPSFPVILANRRNGQGARARRNN